MGKTAGWHLSALQMSAKSKGTWGVRQPRSDEELNQLYKAFFVALVVPEDWKFSVWDLAKDADGTILSIGRVYRDMRTKGLDLKDYKVLFLTFSERGAICEKSYKDYGKYAYKCVTSNLTIEKLNQFIEANYHEIEPSADKSAEQFATTAPDEGDGLQHFRDRFATRVAGETADKPY